MADNDADPQAGASLDEGSSGRHEAIAVAVDSPDYHAVHIDDSNTSPSDQRPEEAQGNKWWTLVAVCSGTFMLLLDVTIVNVALPDIQTALGASFSDLQWVVDAYALTLAALLLTAGSLADLFGRRKLS